MSEREIEDQNMDKKTQPRQSSVPARNSGTEGYRKDGYHSGSRSGRGNKRSSQYAGPASYQGSKPDGYRGHYVMPRGQDKRPQSRGNPAIYQGEKVRVGQGAEAGSVFNTGSKRNNLNHLLNFSFAPREGEGQDKYGDGRFRGKGFSRRAVKFNKEQFLQANCQFVVRSGDDYAAQTADPDALVDWDSVHQVRVAGHEVPSCPICLYPPTAAKMTRCGHIYCWACILHYLSLGEKSWRKCPICYEAVHKKDLKSVAAVERPAMVVGEQITFKLMKRERNSPHVMPVEQWSPRTQPHSVYDEVDLCYAKLLVAPPQYVQEMIDRERVALETQLAEAGTETLEGSFIQAALDSLKEWELTLTAASSVLEMEKEIGSPPSDITHSDSPPPIPLSKPAKGTVEYASAFSDEELSDNGQDMTSEEPSPVCEYEGAEPPEDTVYSPSVAKAMAAIDLLERDELSSSPDKEDLSEDAPDAVVDTNFATSTAEPNREYQRCGSNHRVSHFYFYQAADGQHVYLHSINSRCLVAQYGSLEKAPPVITGTVVELEHVSMTEELRQRRRYLAHLPLTCELQIAEVTLTSPAICQKTLDMFSDDIAKRRHFRQKKERTETRKLKKLQEEADRRMFGKHPHLRYDVSSSAHVPECNSIIVPSAAPAHSIVSDDTSVATPTAAAAEVSPRNDEKPDPNNFSFAQMLRHGKAIKQTEAWPLARRASESELQAAARNTAGSDNSDSEDRMPVPEYQASFGDAIQRALENYDKKPGNQAEVKLAPSSGGKKKKKKKLLFTTTMARGSADH